jgi:hypothetical protein
MESITQSTQPVKQVYSGIGGPVVMDRDNIGEFARLATPAEIAQAATRWIATMGRPLPPMFAEVAR